MYDFSDVLGQDTVKQNLMKAVKADRVSHAYMLVGEKGLGKQTLSYAFAKMLLCERNSLSPCGTCHHCVQIEANTHPDVVLIRQEKAGGIGVNEVREQLAAEICIKPFSGKKRVFIIPDAQNMTVQAQNALLKTMEEPPSYAVILLLTEGENALLETVRSRCVKLKFRPVPEEILVSRLKRDFCIGEIEAIEAARFARGIPRLANLLLSRSGEKEKILHALEIPAGLGQKKATYLLEEKEWILENFQKMQDFLDLLRMYYRDLLSMKKNRDEGQLIFSARARECARDAGELTFHRVGEILDEITRTEDRLKANVNPAFALELLLQVIKQGRRKG